MECCSGEEPQRRSCWWQMAQAANVKQDVCSLQIKKARCKYQRIRTYESRKTRKGSEKDFSFFHYRNSELHVNASDQMLAIIWLFPVIGFLWRGVKLARKWQNWLMTLTFVHTNLNKASQSKANSFGCIQWMISNIKPTLIFDSDLKVGLSTHSLSLQKHRHHSAMEILPSL